MQTAKAMEYNLLTSLSTLEVRTIGTFAPVTIAAVIPPARKLIDL